MCDSNRTITQSTLTSSSCDAPPRHCNDHGHSHHTSVTIMDAPCPSTRTSSTTRVVLSGPVNPVVLLVTTPTFASALAPPISRCTLHRRPCRRCRHDVCWFPARPPLLPMMSCDVSAASTDITHGVLHMNSCPLLLYVPAVAACHHHFVPPLLLDQCCLCFS